MDLLDSEEEKVLREALNETLLEEKEEEEITRRHRHFQIKWIDWKLNIWRYVVEVLSMISLIKIGFKLEKFMIGTHNFTCIALLPSFTTSNKVTGSPSPFC